jgi:hypothetical protein
MEKILLLCLLVGIIGVLLNFDGRAAAAIARRGRSLPRLIRLRGERLTPVRLFRSLFAAVRPARHGRTRRSI